MIRPPRAVNTALARAPAGVGVIHPESRTVTSAVVRNSGRSGWQLGSIRHEPFGARWFATQADPTRGLATSTQSCGTPTAERSNCLSCEHTVANTVANAPR
jgi:hypothetical protein